MKSFLTAFCFALLFFVVSGFSQGIRSVDFKNFTYEVGYCAESGGSDRLTTKNGEFYKETKDGEYVERMFFSARVAAYGDLNGDDREEAVIISLCNGGGTGNFTEAYIYGMVNGKPTRLMTLVGGDRANGGLVSAAIKNGLLEVKSSDVGEFGGACCPDYEVTDRYRLQGKKLVPVGKSSKRELFPINPIEFERGKFGKTIDLDFPGEADVMRFSISAAAGQTLTVSLKGKYLSVRVLRGKANILESGKSLVAKLNESGTFVIEIMATAQVSAGSKAIVKVR